MMNGYLSDNPKFNVGDLVFIDKSLYDNLVDKPASRHVPSCAVVVAVRSHLEIQSHVVPASGNRFFDYQILLSGQVFWVYEDEISTLD